MPKFSKALSMGRGSSGGIVCGVPCRKELWSKKRYIGLHSQAGVLRALSRVPSPRTFVGEDQLRDEPEQRLRETLQPWSKRLGTLEEIRHKDAL